MAAEAMAVVANSIANRNIYSSLAMAIRPRKREESPESPVCASRGG
jgi:hypothetical protein